MKLKELSSIIDENQQIRLYVKSTTFSCKGTMYKRELTDFYLNMKVIAINKKCGVIDLLLESEVK